MLDRKQVGTEFDSTKEKLTVSENVEIIRRWYESPSPEFLDPNSEWLLAEGFPFGGRYVGSDAVFKDFFPRLMSQFSEWKVSIDELLDSGEFVIALGRYQGTVKDTGVKFVAPVAHVWKLKNGKIVQTRQYVDTVLIARALASTTTSQQQDNGIKELQIVNTLTANI